MRDNLVRLFPILLKVSVCPEFVCGDCSPQGGLRIWGPLGGDVDLSITTHIKEA